MFNVCFLQLPLITRHPSVQQHFPFCDYAPILITRSWIKSDPYDHEDLPQTS